MFRSLVPATLAARPHGEPGHLNGHRSARFLPPQEQDQSGSTLIETRWDMRTSLQRTSPSSSSTPSTRPCARHNAPPQRGDAMNHQGAWPHRPAIIRSSRRLLVSGSLAALLLLAGCTAPARTGSAPAGRSAAAPSTAAPAARPARLLLHGRVAFASDRHRNVDIQTLDLPDGRRHRLTSSPAADLSPTWSPDGGRLAFRTDRDGNDEVYLMDADGSGQRNLTRNPASDYSPAWSPDGRRIAFATGRADPTGNDLWLMDADGSHPRSLVQQDGIDEYPVWSPDGSRLAFGCTLGRILPSQVGDFEVCVVNADGSGLRRITDAAGISAAGGWSPDGRRIAFASSRDQDPDGVSSCGDLFVVNADGSHLTRLTSGPANDCRPSFTRDGRHLLFSSDRAHPGADSDLYAMNSDGAAVTRLTHAPDEEQEPAFTPCKGACP
jgi:Tol biopolymer transport system component